MWIWNKERIIKLVKVPKTEEKGVVSDKWVASLNGGYWADGESQDEAIMNLRKQIHMEGTYDIEII